MLFFQMTPTAQHPPRELLLARRRTTRVRLVVLVLLSICFCCSHQAPEFESVDNKNKNHTNPSIISFQISDVDGEEEQEEQERQESYQSYWDHFVQTFRNDSSKYNCNFDHLNYCSFKIDSARSSGNTDKTTYVTNNNNNISTNTNKGGGGSGRTSATGPRKKSRKRVMWNFKTSLQEFANQMKTFANTFAQNVDQQLLDETDEDSNDKINPFEPNYFPCAVNTTSTKTSGNSSKLNNNNNISSSSSSMLLAKISVPILWPMYKINNNEMDNTIITAPLDITSQRALMRLNDSNTLQSSSYYYPQNNNNYSNRRRNQFGADRIHRIPTTTASSARISSSRSSQNHRFFLTCLKMRFRFPETEQLSQLVLKLGPVEQHLVSSIAKDESWSQTKPNQTFAFPRNRWLNLFLPIFMDSNLLLINTDNVAVGVGDDDNDNADDDRDSYILNLTKGSNERVLLLQTNHWTAFEHRTQLEIRSSAGICIDDIYFDHVMCTHQLSWLSNGIGGAGSDTVSSVQSSFKDPVLQNQSVVKLNIDQYGRPVRVASVLINRDIDNNDNDEENYDSESHKNDLFTISGSKFFFFNYFFSFFAPSSSSSSSSSTSSPTYFQKFAGSLILAAVICLLLVLISVTIAMSIVCARPRPSVLSSSSVPAKNKLASTNSSGADKSRSNKPRYKRSRFSGQHRTHELLPTTNQQQQQQPAHNLESSPWSVALQNAAQHISGSSTDRLLLNTDPVLTNGDQKQNSDMSNLETFNCPPELSSTSAIQLLRNWNFHRRRHNSNTPSASRSNKLPASTARNADRSSKHEPTISANAINLESVGALVRTRQPLAVINQSNPYARQSLVLSVNEENQLVILPNATSNQSSTNQQQQQRNPDWMIAESSNTGTNRSTNLASLSEEDAEATRWEMATSVNAMNHFQSGSCEHSTDRTLSTLPRSLLGADGPPSYDDSLCSRKETEQTANPSRS